MKLVEERQIRKSLKELSQEYAEQHRVVKDVFRMFIQNDSSVFFSDQATRDSESPNACLEAIKK